MTKETPMDVCTKCSDDDEDYCDHETDKPTTKAVLVLPGCCEASRQSLFPRVVVERDWDERGRALPISSAKAKWFIPISSDGYLTVPDPEITCCPFCGTKLPAIVKEPNPPSPIAAYDDCGHCACGWPRSHGDCPCWPTEAAFTTSHDSAEEPEKP